MGSRFTRRARAPRPEELLVDGCEHAESLQPMLNNTCRRDAYSDGRCVADASVLSELSGQRFARERTSRGLPPFVDCCTGAAVTDGAQETLEPSNADGSHASGCWCSWPRHLMCARHQVHLPGTSLLGERAYPGRRHAPGHAAGLCCIAVALGMGHGACRVPKGSFT